MAKIFSPKFRAVALELLAAGVSTREAQAQLRKRFRNHVGEGTLRKWKKESDAAAPPLSEPEPTTPAPAWPAPEDEAALPNADVYEHTRRQLATSLKRAEQAAADGNHTAAQRFSGDVVKYTLLLARLDKERKGADDAVTIPRAELERARKAMQDRVAALATDLERTGGITCNHCGRELRINLAKGES